MSTIHTTIIEKIRTLSAMEGTPYRPSACACGNCDSYAKYMEMSLKRGANVDSAKAGRIGLCSFHRNGGLDNATENSAVKGHAMAHGLSFSVTWFLEEVTPFATANILGNDIRPTVNGYLSPLCYSLCHISKIEDLLLALIASGQCKTTARPILTVYTAEAKTFAPLERFLAESEYDYEVVYK